MLKRRRKKAKHKFCSACGAQLKHDDAYCTHCGYSFVERHKKKKNIKWKNVIIILIILAIAYSAFQIFTGKPILPDISKLLNFSTQKP